jgi:3-(3-hydroxy-phenyl)propionate hydroxylase
MTDIVPAIRAGVIDELTGGARLPQPPIEDTELAGVRLDDLLSGRFTLLTFDATPLEDLAPNAAAMWRAIRGQTICLSPVSSSSAKRGIRDVTGALHEWMTTRNARWVVIRPDRYVFGAASTSSQLSILLDLLSRKLRPGSADAGNPIRVAAGADRS